MLIKCIIFNSFAGIHHIDSYDRWYVQVFANRLSVYSEWKGIRNLESAD